MWSYGRVVACEFCATWLQKNRTIPFEASEEVGNSPGNHLQQKSPVILLSFDYSLKREWQSQGQTKG